MGQPSATGAMLVRPWARDLLISSADSPKRGVTLYFFKPVVSIDGGEQKEIPWGESEYSVSPGQHTVNIAIPWFSGWQVSRGERDRRGWCHQTVTLKYRPPLLVTWDANLRRV
jgi:hypothetical protein